MTLLKLNNSLKTLILNNNRIERIENLGTCLPNLKNLILMNNRLSTFNQISSLRYLKNLERLVLMHNPVSYVRYLKNNFTKKIL